MKQNEINEPIESFQEVEQEMKEKKILLKLKHVDVKFNVRGRTLNAIRDANLDIYEGETLAIVGESGSGKSVMTKTFAGMLDSNGFISHGNIYFYDDELSKTTVNLTRKIRWVRSFFLKRLNAYSFEEPGSAEYIALTEMEAKEKAAAILTPEETERFDAEQKRLTGILVDATNYMGTLNRRDKADLEKRYETSDKIRETKKALKALEKERKAAHIATKKAYKADIEARSAYQTKHDELVAKRNALLEEAKARGLSEATLARNEIIANEIVLSLGRYPLRLTLRYGIQLLKGYREAMRRAKDLTTEKQNRRVFEPIVFRVEYRSSSEIETNKYKLFFEEDLLPSIAKDVIDDPRLENESLISQARGLHPHLGKSMIRKLSAVIDEAEAKKIADLILLRAANFNSTIYANVFSQRIVKAVIAYYQAGKPAEPDLFPSKKVQALQGYAHIDCAKVRYLKDWEQIRGCRIATVFQDPMTSLDPIITIGKQIMIVIQKHQHCSAFEAKRRALAIMEKVGIPQPEKRFDDYPFQYSGGMRQRIVIAIALSCQPRILICDEPTTALDVTIQAQILELIKQLSKDLGFTTVYITHDLGVVANVADRVAVLYAGQIVELGTVEDIFYDPRHPYTWALLSSLPQLARSRDELYSISGTPPSLYAKIRGDAFAPRNPFALAIDFVKEPPMIEINDHHSAKTWLLDPRAPKVEKPEMIQNLHEKMVAIYGGGEDK